MCQTLHCRTNINDGNCTFVYGLGAAPGTSCDSGKVIFYSNIIASILSN